ncbi:nuclease-related domain-containing protein [Actinospongicola halichondriae]|uniref:nuclease-related domain-containing protein n=1 Tax=Actinospongicola halichondriae TaxID=3236844 RepID=UPI003D4C4CEE
MTCADSDDASVTAGNTEVPPMVEAPPTPPPLPPPPPPPLDSGAAGASARREHHKRAERERARKQAKIDEDREWRERVKAKRPVLGRVAAAFTEKPQMTPESTSTKVWATGADGEKRVAEVLGQANVVALHDRGIPGSRANIDHIAVGPSGVFVIDAKKYTGKVERRDVGSFFKVDERLYVRGRDRTKLVEGVKRQCSVVRDALGDTGSDITVHGVLCFVGAEWPGGILRTKPITIGHVRCTWPRGLTKLVSIDGPHDHAWMSEIGRRLAEALPPA